MGYYGAVAQIAHGYVVGLAPGDQMTEGAKENWESGGPYEQNVGRWSHEVAKEFLAWLQLTPGLKWGDAGCGTGALVDIGSPRRTRKLSRPSIGRKVLSPQRAAELLIRVALRSRRCDGSPMAERIVRCDCFRSCAELRLGRRTHGKRNDAGYPFRGQGRRLCLGLRSRHANDATFLGRCRGAESQRRRTRPGGTIPVVRS